ncbi:MAG: GNAT family N-acetyltransferase [Pseudomonadota bacterium]
MEETIITTPGVKVQRFREADINGILELMNKEGWYYYDRHELKRYLSLDQDCFTLLRDGRVIGSIFTTNYGNQAWIGNIVVAQEARGMGFAADLIGGVIDHLCESKGVLTFRLGSVPLAIGLYKKAGFHAEAFTTAQEAELPLKVDDEELDPGKHLPVERLTAHDLKAVAQLDARYFKSDRLQLLTHIYTDSIKEGCCALKDQGKIVGFLMIRRRQASKDEGCFAEGPDHAYRLGPCCVLPAYGIAGFKALFQKAIRAVNNEVRQLKGSARMYAVFPRNAGKAEIYRDTRELAKAMGMDTDMDLDRVFDEHQHIFGALKSLKNEAQWQYMKRLGFKQEYFEQVMSHSAREPENASLPQSNTKETKADMDGIFASATPGDKA